MDKKGCIDVSTYRFHFNELLAVIGFRCEMLGMFWVRFFDSVFSRWKLTIEPYSGLAGIKCGLFLIKTAIV